MNVQIEIQKMKISAASITCDMSDRSELGFDCIQLLMIAWFFQSKYSVS